MIIGHQRILDFLKKSAENDNLSHAYLFTGSSHLGKKTIAWEFIKILIPQISNDLQKQKSHPDILIVDSEKIISIGQVRKIQHQISLFPYKADYKVVLIKKADKMTAEAGNCLLKTLEEPPGKAILILVTAYPKLILPTIYSRCQIINFLPVSEEELEKSMVNFENKDLKKFIRLANGRPGLVLKYLKKPDLIQFQNKTINQLETLLRGNLKQSYQVAEEMSKDIPKSQEILNQWLFWFRDLLLFATGCSHLVINQELIKYQNCYSLPKLKSIINNIQKTKNLLTNSSINARLALEALMLELN